MKRLAVGVAALLLLLTGSAPPAGANMHTDHRPDRGHYKAHR